MKISYEEYVRRVKGCFLGKTVGGTLGMPFEGDLSERTVTYYDPVPQEMVANDDLDLQVINLEHILQNGLPVSAKYLGDDEDMVNADEAADSDGDEIFEK